jgi:hypothetical protein
MAEQTTAPKTDRTAAAKKAAATRAAKKTKASNSAKKAAETRALNARTPVQRVQDATEKAVLVQVGAALIARDHVVEAVTGIAGTDVKTAERRGATVRKDLEGRVRKTRSRVEKELRTRRTTLTTSARKRVEHDIKSLRTDFEARTASSRAAVEQLVDTGRTVTSKVAGRVPKVPTPSL